MSRLASPASPLSWGYRGPQNVSCHMTALSLVSGRACRTWTVNNESQPLIKHIVQLKVDTNAGSIEVLVNGTQAHGFDGSKFRSVFDWPATIPYTIPGVGSGSIFLARDQAFVEISCVFG